MKQQAHLRSEKPFDGTGLPPYYAPVAIICMCLAIVYLLIYTQVIAPAESPNAPRFFFVEEPLEPEAEAPQETPPQTTSAAPNESAPKNDGAVQARSTKQALEGNAADAMRKSKTYGPLAQAIGTLEDEGYEVGFLMRNLTTGREVSYDADKDFYPASSIKAPYVTSLYQGLVEPGTVPLDDVAELVEATIVDSDNDSYRWLHELYDGEPFANWLREIYVEPKGYESLEDFCQYNYPRIDTRQLAQMWVRIATYLNGTSEPAQQLKEYLTVREAAPLRDALPQDVQSLGKAGWMDEQDEENEAMPASNEAGIIYTKNGPVVITVMTTVPAELERIVPLISALYQNSNALA